MLVLEEDADSRRDVLRTRRVNDKHYVYDRVFGEDSTQVTYLHTFTRLLPLLQTANCDNWFITKYEDV